MESQLYLLLPTCTVVPHYKVAMSPFLVALLALLQYPSAQKVVARVVCPLPLSVCL